ncbi:MAG: UDP-N-acetylglucosamine--N-acetylmuramyl-(pentapeptide) pyrophosphoryl-undecaprenol N-acetylglucosamine transferase [Candidatus Saccharibacteria bacterium]
MKILAVGGGSGGHVTPVVAVLREIRKVHPRAEIRFWCDSKFADQSRAIMGHFEANLTVQTVIGGKFRRYNHVSMWRQLLWTSVVLMNVRDGFLVGIGFLQSIVKLIIWRPDVVFTKGGYVCLPVGIAARLLGIPLVIHDSDAHPGLTNRILGKWATLIATGAPLEYYSYPVEKARYVGIPIAPEFYEFSDAERLAAKQKWGINPNYPLIVITGGGLGAGRINNTTALVLNDLLKLGSVVLISGTSQYDELRSLTPPDSDRFQLHSFISKDMASLLGAADVVVTRAGATTILELAALVKPTILIPNGKLTGGHQLKNADVYVKANAVIIVDENRMLEDPAILVDAIDEILSNPDMSKAMARRFLNFVRPNAAKDVANMIISSVK